jgi:hypothetical protein
MILTTDGRGEFILVPENQNLYEEFANQEDTFATVRSAQPDDTGHREFDLSYTYDDTMGTWPQGEEERVLVKAAYVYGKKRRIKDLKLDLENEYGPMVAVIPNDGMCDVRIRIRAITNDFDPATVTWNWAYTQANLGLSTSYADYLLSTGEGIMDASGLPSRRETPLAAWNGLEEIYGFELRIEPVGTERQWLQAQWQAKLDWSYQPVGYVILL